MIKNKMIDYMDRAEKLKAHLAESDNKKGKQALVGAGKDQSSHKTSVHDS